MSAKLKLAYFSPVNPVQSGISDYSEELLPYLARYADIDLYLDENLHPSNKALLQQFKTYPASKFRAQAGNYDTYLFHMGNSAAHAYIYRNLLAYGKKGVLVLHDYVLHHFLIGQYLNNGKAQEYIREMSRHYGTEGEATAREVIKGRLPESLFRYPLCEPAIEAAQAVLVHSSYAQGLIKARFPEKLIGVARMGVPLPPLVEKKVARERLGLSQDEFILTSLGHLNPYKRLDSALWAFRAFSREYPQSRFVLVGSPSPNYNVMGMVTALGLQGKVELTGYASGEKYADYLAAADVCINMRYPTAGETSASLLRIMGASRPVLVSRTGAFEELPDDTCVKVDVDEAEEELLLEYLRLLARRPDLAAQLGFNARRHVALQARLSDAAHDYYLFLCRMLGREPEIAPESPIAFEEKLPPLLSFAPVIQPIIKEALDDALTTRFLLEEVAQAAAEVGIAEDDLALKKIAESL
ncbi:glycosyltransferase family 4 protein [Candidatus Chlorohelix sp.]|uniref:glycosyltransferase family 4 protein n=1 Tax=Candidatus Chlorohelix sp. TaxID=3139201 RepID=UPI00307232DB